MAGQDETKRNRSLELCRRTVTTESFIEEARAIYGDRYDYSNVVYKNSEHRVVITCPIHGSFEVFARDHLDGKGCPKCEKGEKFISKLKEKFGNKFGLDSFKYDSSTSPITLICPIHGAFSRTTNQILNSSYGCPECAKEYKDEVHEAAELKKTAVKEEKQKARMEYEIQRLNQWLQEREVAKRNRDKILELFLSGQISSSIYKPYELYKQNVDAHIEGIRSSGWKRQYYDRFKVSNEDSKKLYFYRIGDSFFRFKDEAPDAIIKQSFKKDCNIEFYHLEDYLSHRGCRIYFEGNDLVIVEERHVFIHNLTEKNLLENIEYAKNHYMIDWSRAKIYVFPFNTMYFFISDSFERSLVNGNFNMCNQDNWFAIPFAEDINYHELRRICRQFVSQGSLLKDSYDKNNGIKMDYSDCCSQPHENVVAITTLHGIPKSFVGIDFETLYSQRVSACSIGMVKYIDGVIVDKYYSLIRPPFDYPGKCGDELTWIHGFTEDMLKNERSFPELLPEIERFVNDLPLVAHNASVEKGCFQSLCSFYSINTTIDYENIYDTLNISKRAEYKCGILEEGRGSHTLDAVCNRFGVPCSNHHNALADAEMCGNLMLIFQKLFDGTSLEQISETVKNNHKTSVSREKYNPEDKIQRTDLDNIADNPFKNKVVVLTGFAKADSQEYAHKLNELGAIIKDSVSGKTNYLITGYNAGPSKMQKAQELGIIIMSEENFLEIIKQL